MTDIVERLRDTLYFEPDSDLPEEAANEIEKLRDQLRAASEWRDISTAPRDETDILGWDGKYQFVMYWRGKDHKPHEDKSGWFEQIYRRVPTHWQPLPAPPQRNEVTK